MIGDERLPLRFWAKVEVDDNGCWLWTSAINQWGYPKYQIGRSGTYRAHRVAYQELVGLIPDGLVLDHLCRVRHCVNPEHLEPVTNAENVRRGEPANRTHCPQGHPYDEANTLVTTTGSRRCRECGRRWCHEWRERRRTEARRG